METSLLPDEQLKTPTAGPRRASPTRILQQRVRNGDLRLTGAARPSIGSAEVLVATTHSVVSAGTEPADGSRRPRCPARRAYLEVDHRRRSIGLGSPADRGAG